jgi:hypothetical protein
MSTGPTRPKISGFIVWICICWSFSDIYNQCQLVIKEIKMGTELFEKRETEARKVAQAKSALK